MVRDDQRPTARHVAGHVDDDIVGPRDRAERSGEPVRCSPRIPRWTRARGAELGERVKQPARNVTQDVVRLHAATACLGISPSRSYLGRSRSKL